MNSELWIIKATKTAIHLSSALICVSSKPSSQNLAYMTVPHIPALSFSCCLFFFTSF